jgi:uncharacterized protein YqjF (DUF2071 family)
LVDIGEYLKLRERPDGSPVMYQSWRDLCFLHFSLDPDILRPTVPKELEIDTFPDDQGCQRAWVGLVPFWMTDIRLRGLPAVPGVRTFPETNLRTYVHRNGKEPGVWFYSLEAANRLACRTARRLFGLPYHWSSMSVTKPGHLIDYRSVRRDSDVHCDLQVMIQEDLWDPEPGSLEFFLVERYLLYAKLRGELVTGQVHHKPYGIEAVMVKHLDENLTSANGIAAAHWEHFLYSEGVDVEVFGVKS